MCQDSDSGPKRGLRGTPTPIPHPQWGVRKRKGQAGRRKMEKVRDRIAPSPREGARSTSDSTQQASTDAGYTPQSL